MLIPYRELSADALRGLIEEFVAREGTDYGAEEVSMETKVAQVHRQLERGDVVIAFDPASESINLLTRREAEQLDD